MEASSEKGETGVAGESDVSDDDGCWLQWDEKFGTKDRLDVAELGSTVVGPGDGYGDGEEVDADGGANRTPFVFSAHSAYCLGGAGFRARVRARGRG
jgi:hypothetical protein